MASITIRNLDEKLMRKLRMRAAQQYRSMEEEARRIPAAALDDGPDESVSLGQRIRSIVKGDEIDLVVPDREPVRRPPELGP